MFDDPSQEIDELTGVVKQDIQALNLAIAELQKVSGALPRAFPAAGHWYTTASVHAACCCISRRFALMRPHDCMLTGQDD